MFTGIVTDIGTVAAVKPLSEGVSLRIDTAYDPATIAIGASISCGGVHHLHLDVWSYDDAYVFAVLLPFPYVCAFQTFL